MKLLGWLIPWWVQPAIMLVLTLALLQTRSTLHNARQDAVIAAKTAEADTAKKQAKWALDGKTAAETYAGALAARQPIILRSTNEVTKYAETPAGRALCATADRVQDIDALDSSLFPETP